MKKQITSISLVQTAKVAAVLYFLIGLFAAVFLLLAALFAPGNRVGSLAMALFTPLLYAFFGFVFVFVAGWIYNLVARRIGGVEFTVTAVRGEL